MGEIPLHYASTTFTIITIYSSLIVVIHWHKSLSKLSKELTAQQWFIWGVFLGFLSHVLDNTYWLIGWSGHFVDPNSWVATNFFGYGQYFNLVFRQALEIGAATCHLYALVKFGIGHWGKQPILFLLATAGVFGLFIALLLHFLRA